MQQINRVLSEIATIYSRSWLHSLLYTMPTIKHEFIARKQYQLEFHIYTYEKDANFTTATRLLLKTS